MAELERCKKEIKTVLSYYENNISDLAQLISEFPKITEYISKEKLEEIKTKVSSKMKEPVFYSFDGKSYPTMEEAATANDFLNNKPHKVR